MEYADLQTMLGYCDNMHLANADRIVVSPGVPLQEYDLSSLLHSVSSIGQPFPTSWFLLYPVYLEIEVNESVH